MTDHLPPEGWGMSLLFRPPKHKGKHVQMEHAPNLFELDEILEGLKSYDPVMVWQVRKDMASVRKSCSKYLGIDYPSPR